MKKLSMMIAGATMMATAFAGQQSWVEFSSTGPDKYLDGTDVMAGEVYALVWVKSGAAFAGFNAKGEMIDSDGAVLDAAKGYIVAAAPLAKVENGVGHCPTVFYTLTPEDTDKVGGGTLNVYLMDTRVATADGEGNRTVKVGGINSDGTFTAVNATTAVDASVTSGAAAKVAAIESTNATVTENEASAPTPVITGIKPAVGGKVVLTLSNTVPWIQYGVQAGPTLTTMDEENLVEGINGVGVDNEMELIVNDPQENRFFKVIRKKVSCN